MRAAIYRRVSSRSQEEGTSLVTQEERCREFASQAGYTVVSVWTDVHTGADFHERPALSEVRELIRSGQIDVLLAYDLDRLSRDQIHFGVLFDEAGRHGVRIETVATPLDLTPIGKAIIAIHAMAAEIEREKIRERSKRGKQKRLEQGRLPTWTCRLYGYEFDYQLGCRHIKEDEAEVVRWMFQQVVDGASLHSIVTALNDRGVPSPAVGKFDYANGKTPIWHASSMHHAIKNPAYKGLSVAHRFERYAFRNPQTGRVNKQRERTRPVEQWTILPSELTPAIVSEELWERANRRLSDRRGTAKKNQARPYLLRGLCRCAICGGPMYSEIANRKSRDRIYRCNWSKTRLAHGFICSARTKVSAEQLEAWVWEQALDIIQNRDRVVEELRRRYEQRHDLGHETEAALVRSRIADLTDRQSGLVRREGSIPWSLIEVEVNKLEEDKATLQARLAELEETIAVNAQEALRLDSVVSLIDRLAGEHPESATFEERVRILNDLGISLRLSPLVWILDWIVPVRGVVEQNTLLRFDFSNVTEPTDEEREETRRFEREMDMLAAGVAYKPA